MFLVGVCEMDGAAPRNILVRVPNWIGDAVMCLPALMDIREYFDQSTVTVLARPTIAELLRGHTGIDEVLVYDYQGEHQGLLGLLKLIRLVKKREFDCAVLFQNAFEAAMIAFLSGIASRIGYATDGRRWFLTQPVSLAGTRTLHHTQYYQRLVQAFTHVPSKVHAPQLVLTSKEHTTCEESFPDIFQPSEMVIIGINPGSVYGSAKRWLPERFAEVGDRLIDVLTKTATGFPVVRCVIVGGKGEEGIGADIARRMTHQPIVLSGKTTIRELMGVLTRCAVLVTNDTGPMHMARALGVPVVAIFGSTDPQTTRPSESQQDVVQTHVRCSPCLLRACPIDHRCMTQIGVEEVVDRVLSHLEVTPVISSTMQGQGQA